MISDERLMNFCRALCDTVKSGLSLSEAFDILSKSRKYRSFLAGAAERTAAGEQLHEAFAAQKVFPPVFIALLRAGEEGGKTEEFLSLYADCLEIRIDFRRRMRRAMVYPAFAVLLGTALLVFALTKAIPTLLGSFFTSGQTAPREFLLIAALPGYIAGHWPPLLLALCAAVLVIRTFMRSPPGRILTALAGHWLPVFRFATTEARLYYTYTMFGLLLKAGLAPGAIMDVMMQFSAYDPITRRRFARAAAMFSGGRSFSESMSQGVPPEDLHSLEVAEKAGRLDETLLRMGKLHYDRHLHRLKLLVTWFKLAAMLAVALLAFLMIVAMLRPIMSIMSGPLFGPARQQQAQGAAQPAGAGGRTLNNSYVAKDPAAVFNQVYGKKITDLMGGAAAGKGADKKTGLRQPPKMRKERTNLGQGYKLKPHKFQKPVGSDENPAAAPTTDGN